MLGLAKPKSLGITNSNALTIPSNQNDRENECPFRTNCSCADHRTCESRNHPKFHCYKQHTVLYPQKHTSEYPNLTRHAENATSATRTKIKLTTRCRSDNAERLNDQSSLRGPFHMSPFAEASPNDSPNTHHK